MQLSQAGRCVVLWRVNLDDGKRDLSVADVQRHGHDTGCRVNRHIEHWTCRPYLRDVLERCFVPHTRQFCGIKAPAVDVVATHAGKVGARGEGLADSSHKEAKSERRLPCAVHGAGTWARSCQPVQRGVWSLFDHGRSCAGVASVLARAYPSKLP